MYGAFLVPPKDAGAHLGALFWHKDGFFTACGHGTIAVGAWVVATGLVPAPADGTTDVVIDVPSGRVTAGVRTAGGRVADVTFVNVPGHVHAVGVRVPTSQGMLAVDIAFGAPCTPYSRWAGSVCGCGRRTLPRSSRPAARSATRSTPPEQPNTPMSPGCPASTGRSSSKRPIPRLSGPTAPGYCTTATSRISRTARSIAPRAGRAPPPGWRSWRPPDSCAGATNCCTSRWWDRSSVPGSSGQPPSTAVPRSSRR